jgi:Skp family chaperone for outer membrane proteins
MNVLEFPGVQSMLAQVVKQAAPQLEEMAVQIRDTIKAVDDRLTRIERDIQELRNARTDHVGRRNQDVERSLNGAGS